jgi:outer membrane protein assembly factor BamB
VYALDTDGKQLWRAVVSDDLGVGIGAVLDGVVFVNTYDPYATGVRLLSAENGRELQGQFDHSLACATAETAVLTAEEQVRAVALDDGSERWQYDRLRWPRAVIGDGAAYVSSFSRQVATLGLQDGETRWRRALDGWPTNAAVGPDRIYVGTDAGTLYALSPADGTTQWVEHLDGEVGAPVLAGETVLCWTDAGTFHARAAGDGSARWRFETNGDGGSSPAVVDGTIYTAGGWSYLYALSAPE